MAGNQKRFPAFSLSGCREKEGSYTTPVLADASYPFVDLPPGNPCGCKLFPSSKFTIHLPHSGRS
ncbi:hypothetical protein FYJ39_02650 [Clostridium sp. WCA-389-WT-23D1]|uniref:Uncharacterized protein n=1 Tax=Clostridium porci TaxID=2605778 RepID=A0A7X2NIS0_9CLOT|nr:hypothetical protein [Clostridium porci]